MYGMEVRLILAIKAAEMGLLTPYRSVHINHIVERFKIRLK